MKIKPSSLIGLLAVLVLAFAAFGCGSGNDEGTTGGGDTSATSGEGGQASEGDPGAEPTELEGASNTGESEGGAKMQWASNFDEAMTKAKSEDKMVFIKFTADWCVPCHAMEDEALSDKTIVADLEKISVPVHVDIEADESKDIVLKYLVDPKTKQARPIPYAVLIDGSGKVVADVIGYSGKDNFHAWVTHPEITS